jgi:hypothetical protein
VNVNAAQGERCVSNVLAAEGERLRPAFFFSLKQPERQRKSFFFTKQNAGLRAQAERQRKSFFIREKKCRSQSTGREAEKETKTESETEEKLVRVCV